ncbi:MAG: T9SS type A sorting domain-containing protein [Flavobacteriales bacterium]|nr:T9SS type A sorting domain-containing protein [Flavobacteriales bacterium]
MFFSAFAFNPDQTSAQVTFYRSYDVDAHYADAEAVLEMDDGGYLLVGVEIVDDTITVTRSNGVLLRTDEFGEQIWRKTFMGPEAQMLEFKHGIITSNGSIAVAGIHTDDVSPYEQNLFIGLMDEEGELLWSANVERPSDQFGHQVRELPGGGFAVGGWSNIPEVAPNAYGAYLVCFNDAGDTLWSRTYSAPPPYGSCVGYCLETTSDSGFVLGGSKAAGVQSPLVFRIDQFGDTLWTRVLDTLQYGDVQDVIITDDGNILLTGYGTVTGTQRPFLTKLDPAGAMLWLQTYPEVLPGWALAMAPTTTGYVLGGMTAAYDFRIMSVDYTGELIWSHVIEPTETYGDGYDVIQTSDGGFALCGLHGSAAAQMVLIKTDANGLITSLGTDEAVAPSHPLELAPNPAGDLVSVSYTLAYAGEASIRLLDMNGRLIAQLAPAVAQGSGEHRADLNLAGIPAGCYLVEVVAERESWAARLIKQ